MARARNIKPGFFRNADLVELSFESRLLFIGLWTLADRAGRLEDRPKQIKMELFPADNVDCNAALDDLASTGMVARYTVDGVRYLQVVNFTKHQNPHRDEKASSIPEPIEHDANTVQTPCEDDANTVAIGLNPDVLNPDPRILNPEVSPTRAKSAGDTLFDPFWLAYPRKVGRDAANRAFTKRKPNAELLKTMLAAITTQSKSKQWADGYIPNPATWLNEGRWMDGGVVAKPVEDWFIPAGFDNVHEARNAGCSPSTVHTFHDGKKLEAA